MAYVYKQIRNDNNEVFYVGSSANKDGKYLRAHSKDKSSHSKAWGAVVDVTGFRVEIVIDNITLEEARDHERRLIEQHKSTIVNEKWSGKTRPQEVCDRISRSRQGYSLTATHRDKLVCSWILRRIKQKSKA